MDGMGWMGWDISQTTRNARAPGGANKEFYIELVKTVKAALFIL